MCFKLMTFLAPPWLKSGYLPEPPLWHATVLPAP